MGVCFWLIQANTPREGSQYKWWKTVQFNTSTLHIYRGLKSIKRIIDLICPLQIFLGSRTVLP